MTDRNAFAAKNVARKPLQSRGHPHMRTSIHIGLPEDLPTAN